MTTSHAEGSAGVRGLSSDPKRIGRLIVGAIFLAVFIGYYQTASQMSEGTMAQPGPGMFPTWVAIGGIAVSGIVIVESLLGRAESGTIEWPRGENLKDVLVFSVFITAYILLLPVLGMYIGSVLFAAGFILITTTLAWWKSVLIGTAMGVIITYFFSEILGLRLPSGMFF